MGKNKLSRFADNERFENVFQPDYFTTRDQGFALKGRWAPDFFKNELPLSLELGCGKGDYTIGLARKDRNFNYVGVDVKGARFWRGAKTAIEEGLDHVAFLRIRIDQIANYFAPEDKINQIWITFPDPQPREGKEKKRLTSPQFLERYRLICNPDTVVNLKTDDRPLYEYTMQVVKEQGLQLLEHSDDVYAQMPKEHPVASIQTFYEKMWLEMGKKIHLVSFKLFP
ncbi:MAG: tRNA (guanosine(46)-N7)-methyltransferase TrmB [Flavobacteriales bacterium]|nr:tRNA (guanosine(46)-N7)-methyltransferase TrmB [Flavobacteriales bacterium]